MKLLSRLLLSFWFVSVLLSIPSMRPVYVGTVKIYTAANFPYNFTGINPGDTVALTTGTYNGIDLHGRHDLVFLNYGGQVTFTTGFQLGNVQNIQFIGWNTGAIPGGYGYKYTGTGYAIFDAGNIYIGNNGNGNNRYNTFRSFDVGHGASVIVNGQGNDFVYDGTPASANYYGCTWDSFAIRGSKTMVYQGTYAGNYDLYRVSIGSHFNHFLVQNDGPDNNGVIFRGFGTYGFLIENFNISGPTLNTRDAGKIWVDGGSGTIRNIRVNGGWGYVSRWWGVVLGGPAIPFDQTCRFYNILDINTTHYGGLDWRIDPVLLRSNQTISLKGTDIYCDHVTTGNLMDDGSYCTPGVICGSLADDNGFIFTIHVHNWFGYNPAFISATNISNTQNPYTNAVFKNNASFGSGGVQLIHIDSSNNIAYVPLGQPLPSSGWVVDQTSNIPVNTSPLYGRATDGTDIGGVQSGSAQPPVCIISASPNPVVMPTNTVTLNGSASYDPDGSIVSYVWSQLQGPAQATPNSTTGSSAIYSGLLVGTYRFQLTVTDNASLQSTNTIDVVVSSGVTPAAPGNYIIKDYPGRWLFKNTE